VDADSIKALAFLAGDGTLNRTTGLVSGSNNSDIRIRAVILLGQQNSDEAKTAIKRALSFEVDSFAMTSAFAALAKMGANDTQTIRTMNSAMRRDIATLRNNGTALAYIEAISQLVTASNPDIEAFETISLLSEGAGYNAEVRQRAMNYLKTLWS
jgi:HEAT repeat protein